MAENLDLREEAIRLMNSVHLSEDEVRQQLVDKGMSTKDAVYLMMELEQTTPGVAQRRKLAINRRSELSRIKSGTPSMQEVRRSEENQQKMMIGGLIFSVGLVVTIISYAGAQGGGTYIVAYGAIIFGAIQFARGYFDF